MRIKEVVKEIIFKLLEYSLNTASNEQGLTDLKIQLKKIIPDLSEQYTSFKIEGDYIVNKLRSQHAFQVKLAQEAILMLKTEN